MNVTARLGNRQQRPWRTTPITYALRATNYIALMKAVDPTIKIGVVSTPGEDSYANNTSHPAYNSREGVSHNGWTPVMLATLNSAGVTPDFLVDHFYSESGSDNDQALLQASANWASDAASLRQQITDYIGSKGTNIELLVTENNSDSGPEGKQSTSLVNGLYLADSLAQLMKTEFNSFVWWDLRNGPDTTGDFSASLYGWRTNGDLGVIGNLNTLYPTFYTFKLMQDFVQAGDTVLTATNDYSLLSVYAVRRLNGSLTVLAINKDPVQHFHGTGGDGRLHPGSNATGIFLWNSTGQRRGNQRNRFIAGYRDDGFFRCRDQFQLRVPALLGHRAGVVTGAGNTAGRSDSASLEPIRLSDPGQCRGSLHCPAVHRPDQLDFSQHQHALGCYAQSHQQHSRNTGPAILARALATLTSLVPCHAACLVEVERGRKRSEGASSFSLSALGRGQGGVLSVRRPSARLSTFAPRLLS